MATLDRKRDFGEVFGTADHKYVQDGKKFDHEGKEVGSSDPAPKSKGKAAPVDQVGAQLNE